MSDLHLRPRPKQRLKLKLKPARYLQRVGLETILDERKEKETRGRIVEAIPTLKEMECQSN